MVILASPVSTAVVTARRAAASINVGEIARAYDAYIHAGNANRVLSTQPGDTAHAAAAILARTTQFNDAIVWFVKSDPKLNGDSVPVKVISTLDANATDPEFATKTLSYVVAANINLTSGINPSNIPVAWTRGLRDNGTWAPDSPWAGAGGHIAFLDGHVQWFDKLSVQPGAVAIFKFGTNTPIPTTNISEALPPGAVILGAEPR